MVTREITREHILIPSERHRDPISLVKIHMRRPELSRDIFQRRLLEEHGSLVLAQDATRELVRRYAQLHNIGSTQGDPEGAKIDAVSVLAFTCLNDVVSCPCRSCRGSGVRGCAGGRWFGMVDSGKLQRDQQAGTRDEDDAIERDMTCAIARRR
jgi:hypothetical protein